MTLDELEAEERRKEELRQRYWERRTQSRPIPLLPPAQDEQKPPVHIDTCECIACELRFQRAKEVIPSEPVLGEKVTLPVIMPPGQGPGGIVKFRTVPRIPDDADAIRTFTPESAVVARGYGGASDLYEMRRNPDAHLGAVCD